VDDEGVLDKEATSSYSDIFDAFRLAMKFYLFEKKSQNSKDIAAALIFVRLS
jgi:hypothetical protein